MQQRTVHNFKQFRGVIKVKADLHHTSIPLRRWWLRDVFQLRFLITWEMSKDLSQLEKGPLILWGWTDTAFRILWSTPWHATCFATFHPPLNQQPLQWLVTRTCPAWLAQALKQWRRNPITGISPKALDPVTFYSAIFSSKLQLPWLRLSI